MSARCLCPGAVRAPRRFVFHLWRVVGTSGALLDINDWRVAGRFALFVSRLRRVETCRVVEDARVMLEGDDHRRSMARP